eukprot:CAMPEP_0198259008 /NCGR_PEP_ID=MMETSP1447-20131203/8301_1 /TAXON_ID=420782 /ORGANISM="Chaetoceros dichaeta, Strain CCMP1751" /LENGTH=205 /DNA_ID=CAMNT_0043946283 /DNA_START=198 /DNA_END=815 /DNA_ORIENTATION=+
MDYQPRFYSFQSYPADPNRGIDIPPSYASFVLPSSSSSSSSRRYGTSAASCRSDDEGTIPPPQQDQPYHTPPLPRTIRVYSNALLLMPPVPDLSMPFNIVGLTGTFYACLIGVTLNLLLRKATTTMADEYKGIETKSKLDKLKDKLKGLKDKLKGLMRRTKVEEVDGDDNGNTDSEGDIGDIVGEKGENEVKVKEGECEAKGDAS